MTSDRTELVKRVLAAALDLPSSDRTAFLESECGSDKELLSEVTSLLEAYEEDTHFLENPAIRLETTIADKRGQSDSTSGNLPSGHSNSGHSNSGHIGPYRLVRKIGRGGMGVVHLAERDDSQFRQRVAIKVIRRGQESEEVLQRFLQERQILAGLTHPCIARLLDGGATADGSPYFVMEYVEGLTLLDYCDRNRLDTQGRLRLFAEVCSAVQYAHQNLVVHRDLKPGNILVTTDGHVKLLDFGIAKVLNPALAAMSADTRTDARVMTPEYASPEQVRGEPVTTASDVYSLGVNLYQLLAGRGPFPFDSRAYYKVSSFIVDGEPELPSTAVFRSAAKTAENDVATHNTKPVTPEEVGRLRQTDPQSLRRTLRGDLDAIVLKAMRKEPELRYASAARLAEDLANYLAGNPVSAAGDSVRYRWSKFVKRHGLALAGAATLLIGIFVAGVFHTVQVTRERDRARAEARRAEAVTDFLVELFEVSDPGETRGHETTAREMLDRGAERLEGALSDQPGVQARLYDVVGSIYQRLGLYQRAAPYFDQAIGLSSQAFGARSPELARSASNKAGLLVLLGEHEEAEALIEERLAEDRRIFGDTSLEVAKGLDNQATLFQESGRYEEARPIFEEALEVRRSILGEDHLLVSTSLNNLARLYQDLGEYDLAEPLFRRSVELDRKFLGSPHPELALSMGNLGMLLRLQYHAGNESAIGEAEPLVRAAYEMQREVLGVDHPLLGNAANDLALVLTDLGKPDEAEGLYRESIEIYRRVLGEHTMVAVALNNLAVVIAKRARYPEAVEMFQESLALNRRLLGEDHPNTAYQLQGLGSLYTEWQKPESAIKAYSEALELRRAALGETHPVTLSSVLPLAKLFAETDEPERGLLLLQETRALVAAEGSAPEALAAIDQALGEIKKESGGPAH